MSEAILEMACWVSEVMLETTWFAHGSRVSAVCSVRGLLVLPCHVTLQFGPSVIVTTFEPHTTAKRSDGLSSAGMRTGLAWPFYDGHLCCGHASWQWMLPTRHSRHAWLKKCDGHADEEECVRSSRSAHVHHHAHPSHTPVTAAQSTDRMSLSAAPPLHPPLATSCIHHHPTPSSVAATGNTFCPSPTHTINQRALTSNSGSALHDEHSSPSVNPAATQSTSALRAVPTHSARSPKAPAALTVPILAF